MSIISKFSFCKSDYLSTGEEEVCSVATVWHALCKVLSVCPFSH